MVRVEIDFETQPLDTTLVDAGFTEGARTFFTWEGVPMYLTRTAVKATLEAVWSVSGPGSVIAHDMWYVVDDPGPLGTARRLAPSALSFIGEPVTFCMHPEDMEHFHARHGFGITDLASSRDLQDRYAPGERVVTDESVYVLAAERLDHREEG
jgi:methyltransferase (TIGR00027 family)